MLVYIILTVAVVLFWPSDAFAWGPGTHIETALELLRHTSSLAPAVALLMKKYRSEFIYGMVSADILAAKKFAGRLHHCHNWDIGWKVLSACKSDRERASGYGYLAHLASDIIAHNYYIPYMMIKSYEVRLMNHTYWEMRFDMHVGNSVWDEAVRIVKGDFHEFDALLDRLLKKPLFSFGASKRIFNVILLTQQLMSLRGAVAVHSRFSAWPLYDSEARHYKQLIMKAAREFLTLLRSAPCLAGEPVGNARLKYAAEMRRSLSHLRARGLTSPKVIADFIEGLKGSLRAAMFSPDAVLPRSYEAL